MKTVELTAEIDGDLISIDLDFGDPGVVPTVLSLHGGGPSTKATTKYLSSLFVEVGRSVVSFDFTGHGKSVGDIKEQSLKKRHNQAKSVISYFSMKNMTLIGSSMGGYVAATLLNHVQVANLILFCPAAYAREAWELKFGHGFTEAIRTENSFRTTDLLDLTRKFKGNVLHFIGTEDKVIPGEVTEFYQNAFQSSRTTEFVTLPGCPHPIHRWLQDRHEVREIVLEKIRDFEKMTRI